jgi:hypothetical protein
MYIYTDVIEYHKQPFIIHICALSMPLLAPKILDDIVSFELDQQDQHNQPVYLNVTA